MSNSIQVTNIKELQAHLNKKFKGMMKSEEMKKAGNLVSQTMGRHVGDQVVGGGASGYDYDQSGDFRSLIAQEARSNGNTQATPSVLRMGFGYIPNLNEGRTIGALRNEQTQSHVVGMNGSRVSRVKTFTLKAEKQMPKWIIAEFGMGNQADKKTQKPKGAGFTYTRRTGKEYMVGPSLNAVGGVGGGRKKGFFQISQKGLNNILGDRASNPLHFRTHPGIRPGKVFQRGLTSSKGEIRSLLASGIQSYLSK